MSKNKNNNKALVLDVDGSLLRTDMLLESFWAALGRHPWLCLLAVFSLALNRPALKARLAELAALDITLLPVEPEVLALAQKAQNEGRPVILASGATEKLVQPLAVHLGFSTPPLASSLQQNLTGATKATALNARFGAGNFEYIGDSRTDIPVWQAAGGGYVVAPSGRLSRRLVQAGLSLPHLGTARRLSGLIRAMRPHQWIKNILLFLPLVAAHSYTLGGLVLTLWGVAAFCAAASSIYIVNDLMDLAADRQHPTKRDRPFASGAARITDGMLLSVVLGAGALLGAAAHSIGLALVIALYMVLSLSYSLGLKRLRWVDIFTLAALYTLRVVAGSIAAGVAMSGWLGVFVFPVFLALGAVKRLIELGRVTHEAPLPGRGYARRDRADLRNIAITASVGALVVYTLYTFSDIAATLYQNLLYIRLAALPVALWLARMISRGWQGRMDYDPIVFALRDPVGLGLMAAGAGLLVSASW